MSDVYIARLRASGKQENIPSKVRSLFRRGGFAEFISERDFVAIKLHFGEPGNTGFIPPYNVRPVVDEVLAAGGKPFVTDANTIYLGGRSDAVDHLNVAYAHGFLPAVVGAPVLIADGLRGSDFVKVPVGLKHFEDVNVSGAAVSSEAIIGVTHFKGHMLGGFGGTLFSTAAGNS